MKLAVEQHYAAQADREERIDRSTNFHQYGGNAAVAQLRCFKYYHPDQGSFLEDLEGRQRWLGPKASRIWAIAHRDAGTQTTMKAIAEEAMCCVSTVSRALTRLQAFGLLAVDVRRGRNGGITVQLARVARQFKAHIEAAWRRIRSWINVASRSPGDEVRTGDPTSTEDATFNEAWDAAEHRGRLLAREIASETPPPLARDPGTFNPGRLTADNVIYERYWLDTFDPDWDLELEKVRDSYGLS